MRKTLIRIINTIILFVIFAQTPVFAISEKEKKDRLEKEQSQINNKIDKAEDKINEIKKEKSKTMKSVENLVEQISTSERNIDIIQTQIDDLEKDIKDKFKELEDKEKEYIEQEELLNERLIAIYKNGNTSYLDIFLRSKNMSDFLARFYSATELIECDKKLIKTTQEQKNKIEEEKKSLESKKVKLDEAKTKRENQKRSLVNLKKNKDQEAQKLSQEEKEMQAELEQLLADNRKIERDIREAERRYQEELRKLQEDSKGNNTPTGKGYFIRPVSGGHISATSHYSSGRFHGAIDYAIPCGTKVSAAADGVVMATHNLSGSYGTYVIIRHANGLQSYYAHGTKGSIVVSPGQRVHKGQKIMLSGNSGRSSGPHLHFEVRRSPYNYSHSARGYGQDSRVDPLKYL